MGLSMGMTVMMMRHHLGVLIDEYMVMSNGWTKHVRVINDAHDEGLSMYDMVGTFDV